MQFNSYVFILLFLPLQVIVYFLANKLNERLGKLALLAGSVVFYAYSDLSVLTVLAISAAVNYLFSLAIRRLQWRRVFLAVPIVVNVGLLVYFKYTDLAIETVNAWFGQSYALKNLVQPLGISFFTFQQIAYLVAVYRGQVGASLLDYLVYILYFPKILMGPLMEPEDFFTQLNDPALKRFDWDHLASGIKLFSFGLLKKVLLADTFASAVSWGFDNLGTATSMDWIIVTLAYTFEIYFDFSGYSDMATGASLMLNITLPINFDSPFKAVSVADFWKRWHISTTRFFTHYIYVPLGGSRKGKWRTYLNTVITFLASGMWHGAGLPFLLWGLLHGLFCVWDRVTKNWRENVFLPLRWLLTFQLVGLLRMLFLTDTVAEWWQIISTMYLFQTTTISDGLIAVFALPEAEVLLDVFAFLPGLEEINGLWLGLFFIAAFLICLVPENNYRLRERHTWPEMLLAAGAFVWAFTCLGGESVFIYNRF